MISALHLRFLLQIVASFYVGIVSNSPAIVTSIILSLYEGGEQFVRVNLTFIKINRLCMFNM